MKVPKKLEAKAEARRDEVRTRHALDAHVQSMSDAELLAALEEGEPLRDGPLAEMVGLRKLSDDDLLAQLAAARQGAGERFTLRPPVRVEDDPVLMAELGLRPEAERAAMPAAWKRGAGQ